MILLLGDSYGGSPVESESWIYYVKAWMSNETIYSAYVGGAAFSCVAAIKFITLVETAVDGYFFPVGMTYYADADCIVPVANALYQYYTASVSDTVRSITKSGATYYVRTSDCNQSEMGDAERGAITTILVNAGLNDSLQSPENIRIGLKAFCESVKTLFPNAKIVITMCELSANGEIGGNLMQKVVREYARGVQGTTNCILVSGSQYTLRNYSLLKPDMVHPLSIGSKSIAASVVNVLRGGPPLGPDSTLRTTHYDYSGDASAGGEIMVYCANYGAIAFGWVTFDFSVDLSDGAWHEVASTAEMTNFAGNSFSSSPMIVVQAKVGSSITPTVWLEIRWKPEIVGVAPTSVMYARIRGVTTTTRRYVLNQYAFTLPIEVI